MSNHFGQKPVVEPLLMPTPASAQRDQRDNTRDGNEFRHGERRCERVTAILVALWGFFMSIRFVAFGMTRVLPDPGPVTFGARLLIFPGAVALWPYTLMRWLKASR